MKIFINTDLEGASGFARQEYVFPGSSRADLVAEGRNLLIGDVNACIAGCFRAGATEVTVRDGHAGGGNITRSKLDDRANFIDGPMRQERFSVLKDYDAMILLAVHAMANTPGAILDHSFSSSSIQNVWLNGDRIGEVGILAQIAAEYEVPCILVTGDDKVCAEAIQAMPSMVACEVKKGYSRTGGFFPPLAVTRKLIEEKTIEAIQKFKQGEIATYKPTYPCILRCERKRSEEVPSGSDYRILDSRTYEVEGKNLEEAYFKMFS